MHVLDARKGVHLRLFASMEGVPANEFGPDTMDDDPADETPTVFPRTIRLSTFFKKWVVPLFLDARGSRPNNTRQYGETVRLWCQYTGDPPIAKIDERVCLVFLQAISNRPGRFGKPLSPNTVIKHRFVIQKCLDLAGPRSRDNHESLSREGLFGVDQRGLPCQAPYIPRPRGQQSIPTGGWTFREMTALLEACEPAFESWRCVKYRPFGEAEPADFFAGLFLFLYNTALRIGSALAATRDMIHGHWLEIPARDMKGGRRGHKVYLNRYARRAMLLMGSGGNQIVPYPFLGNCLRHHTSRILDVSGIPEERRRVVKPCHGFRARCLTVLWGKNPGIAKLVAGHVSHDVTLGHYIGADIMRDALKELPQPKLPERLKRIKSGVLQRMLFEPEEEWSQPALFWDNQDEDEIPNAGR